MAVLYAFPDNRVVWHALAQLPLRILCSMVHWDQLWAPHRRLCDIYISFLIRRCLDWILLLEADSIEHVRSDRLCLVHARRL